MGTKKEKEITMMVESAANLETTNKKIQDNLESENALFKEQFESSKKRNDELVVDEMKLKAKIQESSDNVADLELQLAETRGKCENLQNEILSLENESSELRKQVEDVNSQKIKLIEDKTNLECDLLNKQRNLMVEEKKCDGYFKIIENLKSQISERSDELKTHNSIYETEKAEMNGLVSIFQEQLQDLNAENEVQEQLINRMKAEFEEYKIEADEQVTQLEEIIYQLEHQLEASQTDTNLKGNNDVSSSTLENGMVEIESHIRA